MQSGKEILLCQPFAKQAAFSDTSSIRGETCNCYQSTSQPVRSSETGSGFNYVKEQKKSSVVMKKKSFPWEKNPSRANEGKSLPFLFISYLSPFLIFPLSCRVHRLELPIGALKGHKMETGRIRQKGKGAKNCKQTNKQANICSQNNFNSVERITDPVNKSCSFVPLKLRVYLCS